MPEEDPRARPVFSDSLTRLVLIAGFAVFLAGTGLIVLSPAIGGGIFFLGMLLVLAGGWLASRTHSR